MTATAGATAAAVPLGYALWQVRRRSVSALLPAAVLLLAKLPLLSLLLAHLHCPRQLGLLLVLLLLLLPHLHAPWQVDCADEQARLLPAVEVNLPTLARDLWSKGRQCGCATLQCRSGFCNDGNTTSEMMKDSGITIKCNHH
jgi:hypothetical protein